MGDAGVVDAVQTLRAAVDDLCKHARHGGFGVLDDEQFTELAREVEAIRRQLATVDYPIIAEIEAPHEAAGRVREAAALGERAAVSGQVLDPLRPRTAAARRHGVLSGPQAALIVKTLAALPDSLPPAEVDAAEATLVDAAHLLDPADLNRVARHLLDVIDPDGTPPSEEQIRRREFSLRHDSNGDAPGQ